MLKTMRLGLTKNWCSDMLIQTRIGNEYELSVIKSKRIPVLRANSNTEMNTNTYKWVKYI